MFHGVGLSEIFRGLASLTHAYGAATGLQLYTVCREFNPVHPCLTNPGFRVLTAPSNPIILARGAFVKTNRRAVSMMFVRLSGMRVHCDHTVHVSAD